MTSLLLIGLQHAGKRLRDECAQPKQWSSSLLGVFCQREAFTLALAGTPLCCEFYPLLLFVGRLPHVVVPRLMSRDHVTSTVASELKTASDFPFREIFNYHVKILIG